MSVTRMTFVFVLVIMLSPPARPANAGVIITITQVGSDVVATGSGTIDLTDLKQGQSPLQYSALNPTAEVAAEGPTGANPSTEYEGIIGPHGFGDGGPIHATTGTGDVFGVAGDVSPVDYIIVPPSYVSGTELSATDTYSGQTFSSIGLTPGTYTWTWGTGANADYLTVQIETAVAVPEPSSAVLASIGAVAAFLVYSRPGRGFAAACFPRMSSCMRIELPPAEDPAAW
jgi:hypothetical protein